MTDANERLFELIKARAKPEDWDRWVYSIENADLGEVAARLAAVVREREMPDELRLAHYKRRAFPRD